MIKRYQAKKNFFTKNKGFTVGNKYFLKDEEAKELVERNLMEYVGILKKKEDVKPEKEDKKIIKKEVTKK